MDVKAAVSPENTAVVVICNVDSRKGWMVFVLGTVLMVQAATKAKRIERPVKDPFMMSSDSDVNIPIPSPIALKTAATMPFDLATFESPSLIISIAKPAKLMAKNTTAIYCDMPTRIGTPTDFAMKIEPAPSTALLKAIE